VKALVLLREVLDATLPLEPVDGRGVRLKGSEPIRVLNPADRAALEWACRLRQGEITALTVGPPEVEGILRLALARGASRAIRAWVAGMEGSDAPALARLLALAVDRLGPDLVLTGDRSLEGGTGLVPGLLAARLGWPHLDGATHLGRDGARIVVRRRLERGWGEEVEATPPVVVAVEAGSIEPRYVSVRVRREALARPLEVWGAAHLGVDVAAVKGWVRSEVASLDWPRPRPRRVTLPDARLTAGERMRRLMTAGPTPLRTGEGRLLEGDPREVAERLVRFLEERGLL